MLALVFMYQRKSSNQPGLVNPASGELPVEKRRRNEEPPIYEHLEEIRNRQ
jgi:hypothetical protein